MITLVIDCRGLSHEIAFKWLSLDLTNDKSTLVQVMAWCHQATSHYLMQCWPRSTLAYGITRPQWINVMTCENDDKTWSPTKKESAQFLPVHTNISIISISKRISRVGIMFCKSYFKHDGNKTHSHNIKEHLGMLFPILFNTHYGDLIMRAMASPASRLFTQQFIQTQIKENIKAPHHWPLCGEFTGDRWIPHTNGQ